MSKPQPTTKSYQAEYMPVPTSEPRSIYRRIARLENNERQKAVVDLVCNTGTSVLAATAVVISLYVLAVHR